MNKTINEQQLLYTVNKIKLNNRILTMGRNMHDMTGLNMQAGINHPITWDSGETVQHYDKL